VKALPRVLVILSELLWRSLSYLGSVELEVLEEAALCNCPMKMRCMPE
jgi:hypothetical protein